MRYQSSQSNCGPAALRNALLARGIERSESELEALSGCGVDGTGPRDLIRALRHVAQDHAELTPAPLSEGREDIALLRLLAALQAGSVAILCVDELPDPRNSHWVVAFGVLGSGAGVRIHVADSADPELVLHYTPRQLLTRWRGTGRRPFYGVLV